MSRRTGWVLLGCLVVFVGGAFAATLAARSEIVVISDRGIFTCPVLGGGTSTFHGDATLDQRDTVCSDAVRATRLVLEAGTATMIAAIVAASLTAWRARNQVLSSKAVSPALTASDTPGSR